MKSYYVYILLCNDGSYYTGVTNNLDERLAQHNSGYAVSSYTFKRRPVILKFSQQFHDINQAIALEKQIKGWSRKRKNLL
jgi:putative endonuclease